MRKYKKGRGRGRTLSAGRRDEAGRGTVRDVGGAVI